MLCRQSTRHFIKSNMHCVFLPDEVHRQLRMCDAEFLFTTSVLAPTALQAARGTRVKVVTRNISSLVMVCHCDVVDIYDQNLSIHLELF